MIRAAIAGTVLLLTAPATAQPVAAAPNVKPHQLFAIVFAPGSAWKPGRPFAEQGLRPHFDYWMAKFRAGQIVTAGPWGSDGGLVVFHAPDQAAAETVLREDPAIVAGIFTGQVRRYAPPMVNADALRSKP